MSVDDPYESHVRALEESIGQIGQMLRRLALCCGFIAVRLGDELSDTVVMEPPARLVAYRVQGLSVN